MKGDGGVWNNILTLITKMHITCEVGESVMRRKLGNGYDIRFGGINGETQQLSKISMIDFML